MFTYQDLLGCLQKLSPEQLQQEVQILPNNPDCDKPTELLPIYCCETLAKLEVEQTRSSVDHEHHPEAIVLMADGHPFDEDGAIGEYLFTGEKIYPRH